MALNAFPLFPHAISVVYGDFEISDPVAEMRAENGFVDARYIRSRPLFSLIRDIYTLVEADADTLMNFLLQSQRLRAIPFLYTNPVFGTGVVRLLAPKLPGKIVVQGNPSWFEITLEVEEMP